MAAPPLELETLSFVEEAEALELEEDEEDFAAALAFSASLAATSLAFSFSRSFSLSRSVEDVGAGEVPEPEAEADTLARSASFAACILAFLAFSASRLGSAVDDELPVDLTDAAEEDESEGWMGVEGVLSS